LKEGAKRRGRPPGIKEAKPRFKRTKKEILLGLNEEEAREKREEEARIAEAQKIMNKEEARKTRVEKLKLMAGNKSDAPKIRQKAEKKPKKKPEKLFTRRRIFADTEEVLARIRKNAQKEVDADPLLRRRSPNLYG